MLLITPLS